MPENSERKGLLTTAFTQSAASMPFALGSLGASYKSGLLKDIYGPNWEVLKQESTKPAKGTGKLIKHMRKNYPGADVPVSLGKGSNEMARMMGPHFIEGGDFKRLNPMQKSMFGKPGVHARHVADPGIIGHELGHAVDFRKLPRLKGILRTAGTGLGSIGSLAALTHEDTAGYAPAIAAGGSLPMLWQEAKASHIGQKAVGESLGREAQKKSRKLLMKAFGSYAGGAGSLVLGSALAGRLLHGKKKKEDLD